MPTLHLLTHPEATHVVDGLVGGWYDTDLTARGEAQAAALAVELDPDLRAQSYGAAEGRPVGAVAGRPPSAGDDPLRHHDGVPGSETRLEVATRVHAAVRRHLTAAPAHLVVVTHGGAATYVVTSWIGMPLESVGAVRFVAPPGSISTLREDATTGDRRVEVLGDRRHLDSV